MHPPVRQTYTQTRGNTDESWVLYTALYSSMAHNGACSGVPFSHCYSGKKVGIKHQRRDKIHMAGLAFHWHHFCFSQSAVDWFAYYKHCWNGSTLIQLSYPDPLGDPDLLSILYLISHNAPGLPLFPHTGFFETSTSFKLCITLICCSES